MEFAKYYDRIKFRDLVTEKIVASQHSSNTNRLRIKRTRPNYHPIIDRPNIYNIFNKPPTINLVDESIIEHEINTEWIDPGFIATSANGINIPLQDPTHNSGIGVIIKNTPPNKGIFFFRFFFGSG